MIFWPLVPKLVVDKMAALVPEIMDGFCIVVYGELLKLRLKHIRNFVASLEMARRGIWWASSSVGVGYSKPFMNRWMQVQSKAKCGFVSL